jgi:flagellar biosynthetic protein FliR
MFDINMAGQGSGIGNFLSITAVILFFATNLHHLMLAGLFDSYTVFPPGASPLVGDMADSLARLLGDIFRVAIKLSSPLIVMALMIYLGSGLLSRLMPNMHVFFVIIPPQILLSFIVLMFILSGMMLWYLDFAEATLNGFLGTDGL